MSFLSTCNRARCFMLFWTAPLSTHNLLCSLNPFQLDRWNFAESHACGAKSNFDSIFESFFINFQYSFSQFKVFKVSQLCSCQRLKPSKFWEPITKCRAFFDSYHLTWSTRRINSTCIFSRRFTLSRCGRLYILSLMYDPFRLRCWLPMPKSITGYLYQYFQLIHPLRLVIRLFANDKRGKF